MFTGCTYKVSTARAGDVTMTEREIAQRYRYNIWAVHGDAIEHDAFCQNPKHINDSVIVLPDDPWGDPSEIVSPF